jgi:ribosome biogenesis GTPase
MDLPTLGWSAPLARALERLGLTDVEPARVVRADRLTVRVWGPGGERTAHLPGRARHAGDRPVVGDWVAVEPLPGGDRAVVRALLPRRTLVRRAAPSDGGRLAERQGVVANVDRLCIVVGLDRDWNVRRLERFLALAADSGAAPLVVLNKADLRPDADRCVADATAVASGVPVCACAAATGHGTAALAGWLAPGSTAALVGPSGAGKSTLLNALLGEPRQRVQAARAHDHRGRHTTSHRELFVLPGGGLLIDTPGLRELGLWGDPEAVDGGFPDVAAAARACRFPDCAHESEPGCAVWDAVAAGTLAGDRLESYQALRSEIRRGQRRAEVRARRERRGRSPGHARKAARAERRAEG